MSRENEIVSLITQAAPDKVVCKYNESHAGKSRLCKHFLMQSACLRFTKKKVFLSFENIFTQPIEMEKVGIFYNSTELLFLNRYSNIVYKEYISASLSGPSNKID